MSLQQLRAAAYAWHSAVPPTLGYHLAYEEVTDNVSTWNNEIWFQELLTSGITATLIGTDTDTGIKLYHLQGIQARYSIVEYVASHDVCFLPSTTFSHVNKQAPGQITIDIDDNTGGGGSDVRPLDDAAIYGHAGYPVVAAISSVASGDYPIAGGDAAELTVAAALSAIFPSGVPNFDFGAMHDPFSILIKLRDNTTAQ
jgi:hypothetical protein